MLDQAPIKTITICSSSKFYATAKKIADILDSQGIEVFTPRFEYSEELVAVSPEEKISLTREFLAKIKRSDAIYVIAENGYTGRSVCIEMGYATGLGKTVILSEQPSETAVVALASAIVSVDELPFFLKSL
jgi:nucleoside 2-deoxyribosyltransferase